MLNHDLLTVSHQASTEWHKLVACIGESEERTMLDNVCSQFESSTLALSLGLYRPAFTSLRLTLEFGLAVILFTSNNLSFREWQNGKPEADIKWSAVNDPDSGVFSHRFISAFFPKMVDHASNHRDRARLLYRQLSQFVHGNPETWRATGLQLAPNSILVQEFLTHLKSTVELLQFAFCCRYLCGLAKSQLDEVQPILFDSFTHIEPIRVILGGPKNEWFLSTHREY